LVIHAFEQEDGELFCLSLIEIEEIIQKSQQVLFQKSEAIILLVSH
jgi:hypothetical protein